MIYDYKVTTGTGEELNLADFKGKVILIVNTATGCGFTPQYEPIEKMYRDYHDCGLEILDIPCNQFGGRGPDRIRFSRRLFPRGSQKRKKGLLTSSVSAQRKGSRHGRGDP